VTTSGTAEYVAFYRALETLEPRRAPLFGDPYAERFLGRRLALALSLARVTSLRPLVLRVVDAGAPGARLAAAARTRFIDDGVRHALAGGARQLVQLGAGYDCRAYRLRELGEVPIFEVDREEMQARKRACLARAGVDLDDGVRCVTADLEHDDPGPGLARAGFDTRLPAIAVLEGLLNYLSEGAAWRLLAWAGRLARGSTVIFSYVHRGLFDGTLAIPGGRRLLDRATSLAEPWRSSFSPDTLTTELAALGLALREDLGSDEYRSRYLPPDAGAVRFSFYRLAVAEVC